MPFKLMLIDADGRPIPEWVAQDLSAAGIEYTVTECPTSADLLECAAEADALWLYGSRVITPESLPSLPQLGAIIRTGSGTDNVPVAEATERGIVVANTSEAHSAAVSDHAIGLLMAVIRQVASGDRSMRRGEWNPDSVRPAWHMPGSTLGLVGFGHAARLVAKKMLPFGLKVLAHDPFVSAETIIAAGASPAALDELLAHSDFVSLHTPLTPGTYHLIGEPQLRLMKPTAILVNTARGPVVDEPALVRALSEGWIAAAGLDVLEEEHADPNNSLFKMENVVVTPHLAGASDQHEELCWRLAVDSAIALANGQWPRSVVNRQVTPRWPLS